MTPLILTLLSLQLSIASLTLDTMQAHAAVMTPTDYELYAVHMADFYGIDEDAFVATLQCESRFEDGQSEYRDPTGPNGREDSWGIAQIHLPAHKDITKEQAQDGIFAITWAAQQFKAGKAAMWTCWRTYERSHI